MIDINTITKLISEGKIEKLQKLIDEKPDVLEIKDENGSSAFMTICYSGNAELMGLAIRKKRSFNMAESCVAGLNKKVIEIIELHPPAVNSYAPDGFTPVGLAAFFGHHDVVLSLLKKGADPNKAANNPLKVNALHAAVSKNSNDTVAMLLEYGANVNQEQQSGITPLHAAAHNGNLYLVKLLINNGADKNLKSDDGKDVIAYAEENNHEKLLEYLRKL